MDDAGLDGDVLALETVRIAAAVPALVLGPHHGANPVEEGHGRHDPLADDGVLAHDGRLLLVERAGLVQDIAGNADLPDVVQQRAIF